MAQVNFAYPDFYELCRIDEEEAIEKLTMLGFPAEKVGGGDELTVEVTPNRPDALCVEGLARVLNEYINGAQSSIVVGKPVIDVVVDASVADVRPAFCGAVVRNVRITDSALRSIMQIQEKLHETLGRKRRKVAIGIHDLDRVSPPFKYFACGREDVSFVPLDRQEKMTPLEILKRHEKGMDYSHLVGSACPMIIDRRGDVLSFPPIINGELTRVTSETRNVFIDTTGTSQDAVRQAVNIVCAVLAMRGGDVEEITVNGKPCRILQERKWPLPVKESARLLGIGLKKEEIASLLSKMGHRVEGDFVFSPGFRADVINEVDLVEDVAIAYGFNNFEPKLPGFASFGNAGKEPPCHEILVGLGFDEVLSWTLSNPKKEEDANILEGERAKIGNPLTSDFTIFRSAILPNILTILSESKNEKLPIKIYEVGPVALPGLKERVCFASMHPKASFSEIKGLVLSLFESMGKEARIEADEYGPFVKGRCASVIANGKRIGFFGEIAPEVLVRFNLEQPVCACEMEA